MPKKKTENKLIRVKNIHESEIYITGIYMAIGDVIEVERCENNKIEIDNLLKFQYVEETTEEIKKTPKPEPVVDSPYFGVFKGI